jgi:acyl carrier protein
VTWPESFEHLLRAHCRFLPDDAQMDGDASLASLGIDSLEIVEIIVKLEDEFQIEIPQERLTPEAFASPLTIWNLVSSLIRNTGEVDVAH